MVFYPDGRDNGATVVSTADKQGVTNPDYKDELAAYWRDREINAIMRQRSAVKM